MGLVLTMKPIQRVSVLAKRGGHGGEGIEMTGSSSSRTGIGIAMIRRNGI